MDKSTGNKTQENTFPVLSPLTSTGLSAYSWRLFPRSPRPPPARPIPPSCARQPQTPRAWSHRLPARGEPASNAVLRAPLAQTLAAIGVDTEIEMRSAALRRPASRRLPDLRPPSPPSSPGPRAPGRRADSLDNPQTFYRFLITPMEPSVCSPPPPTVPTDWTSRSRRFRDFSKGASRTVSNKTRSGIDNSFTLAAR